MAANQNITAQAVGGGDDLLLERAALLQDLGSAGEPYAHEAWLNAPERLKADPDAVRLFLSRSGSSLAKPEFAAYRDDRAAVLAAVRHDGESLRYASATLRDDREVVLTAVLARNGSVLRYASDRLRGDRELVLKAASGLSSRGGSAESLLRCCDLPRLRGDREIALAARSLVGFSEEVRRDREVVLEAVRAAGWQFQLIASDEILRGDREILMEAVRTFDAALGYATGRLPANREASRPSWRPLSAVRGALSAGWSLLRRSTTEEVDDKDTAQPKDCGFADDKEIVLRAVEQDGRVLDYASKRLQDDKEIVLEAVRRCGSALEFASARLRDDREVALAAVLEEGESLRHASARLRADAEVVATAVATCGVKVLDVANWSARDNEEVMLVALAKDPEEFMVSLRGDRSFWLRAVKDNGHALRAAPEKIRGDREVVEAAVERTGSALEHASNDLRADLGLVRLAVTSLRREGVMCLPHGAARRFDIVLAAVARDGDALRMVYGSAKLRDKDFAIRAIEAAPRDRPVTLHVFSDELRDDREVVVAALMRHPASLQYASRRLRSDPEIVLLAAADGDAFRFASGELRADKGVVTAAVERNPANIEHAILELRSDADVARAVATSNGIYLRYAPAGVRRDRGAVLAAVGSHGFALRWADPALRHDRQVVLAAVRNCGLALQFASPALRADEEVVSAAVGQDSGAVRWADVRELVVSAATAAPSRRPRRPTRAPTLTAARELSQSYRQILRGSLKTVPWALRGAPDAARDDNELVREAVEADPENFQFASERLRGTRFVALVVGAAGAEAARVVIRSVPRELLLAGGGDTSPSSFLRELAREARKGTSARGNKDGRGKDEATIKMWCPTYPPPTCRCDVGEYWDSFFDQFKE